MKQTRKMLASGGSSKYLGELWELEDSTDLWELEDSTDVWQMERSTT